MSDLPEQGSPLLPRLLPHTAALLPSPAATAASPCESNYCNWAGMESGVRWSLSSSPPSLLFLPLVLSLRYSCTCCEMTSMHLSFFFFFPPFPLTLPVTQKSINSFQVRSKAWYTVQTCGTIKSSCGQRPGRTDEGRLLPPFTYVWSSRKQTGGDWTWFQPASP